MIFLKVWKSWFVASGVKSSRCLDLNLNHMQSNDVKIEVTNLWTSSPVVDVVAFVVVAGLCVFYSDGI